MGCEVCIAIDVPFCGFRNGMHLGGFMTSVSPALPYPGRGVHMLYRMASVWQSKHTEDGTAVGDKSLHLFLFCR